MWLPKEERDLLAYYYKNIEKPNEWETLSFSQLTYFIEHGKEPIEDIEVLAANERLQERGFIELIKNDSVVDAMSDRLEVKLTLQGWDIGRKYSHFFSRSGLWYAEYKHHWLWNILSFLGGIIGTLLVNWLSKKFV